MHGNVQYSDLSYFDMSGIARALYWFPQLAAGL